MSFRKAYFNNSFRRLENFNSVNPNRILIYKKIINNLLILNNIDKCKLIGKGKCILKKKKINSITHIPTYTYSINLNPEIEIILKIIKIGKKREKKIMNINSYNNYIYFLKYFSDLVLKGLTENFVILYHIQKCINCPIDGGECNIIFLEKIDKNFYEIENLSYKGWLKLLVKIFKSLKFMYSHKITHGDFHPGNCLIKYNEDGTLIPIINDLDGCVKHNNWSLPQSKYDIIKFLDRLVKESINYKKFKYLRPKFIKYYNYSINYKKDINLVDNLILKIENDSLVIN